jgi:hypothetical protein
MADLITTHPDKSQTWTTEHGDTVRVYLASGLGELLDWRWRVRAKNGETVGQGEGHPRRRSARYAAMRHHPPAGSPEEIDQRATEAEELERVRRVLHTRLWPLVSGSIIREAARDVVAMRRGEDRG